jgi:hypothetical protein
MNKKQSPKLIWFKTSDDLKKKFEEILHIGDSIRYDDNMYIMLTYFSCQEVRDLLKPYIHNNAVVFVVNIDTYASINFNACMYWLECSKPNNIQC